MLNPLKLLKMKQQAEQVQKELEKEVFVVEQGRITIEITGSQKVIRVLIDGQEVAELKDAINQAIQKAQQAAAVKLSDISKEMGLG